MVTYAIIFITLGLLFMILMCLVAYSPLSSAWWNGGYWWIFIFVPTAFFVTSLAAVCYVRHEEQNNTKKRLVNLHMALQEAQIRYLSGTGIGLEAGDYGSWIEVTYFNHKKTLEAPVVRPVPVYDDFVPGPAFVQNPVYQEEMAYRKSNSNYDDRSGSEITNYKPNLFDFDRRGPPVRNNSNNYTNNPNADFMNGIRQEREQVMLDMDRRNFRRDGVNGNMNGPGSPRRFSPNRNGAFFPYGANDF